MRAPIRSRVERAEASRESRRSIPWCDEGRMHGETGRGSVRLGSARLVWRGVARRARGRGRELSQVV